MEFKLKQFEVVINVSRIANIHYFEFTYQYHTIQDRHAFRELIYVDSSSIFVDAEHYSGSLLKNQMIIHQALELHSLACPNNDAPNVIIIGFECKSEELDCFSTYPVTLSSELQRSLTEIIKEGRTVFLPPYDLPNLKDMKKLQNYPFGADQMIKLKLETFLISLIRNEKNTVKQEATVSVSSKIIDVYSYLNKNYREIINLDELCFLYGTNKTTLCSQFKQAFGATIIDYVNQLKVREAKILLREGDHNITQIALGLGFSSIHYFSRLFKHYVHLSPSDYVKTIKSRLGM